MAEPAALTMGGRIAPWVRPAAPALALALVQLVAAAGVAAGVPVLAPAGVVAALALPGYAVLRHLRLRDPLLEWLLGLVLAIATIGLLALAGVYAGAWAPRLTVAAVLAAGVAAAAAEARAVRADPMAGTRPPPAAGSTDAPVPAPVRRTRRPAPGPGPRRPRERR